MGQEVSKRAVGGLEERNVLEASVAIRSNISLTNEFKMAIALFEIPVSGWTCLRTRSRILEPKDHGNWNKITRTLVDVRGVSLLPGLSPLFLAIGIGRSGSLGGLLGLGLRSGFSGSLRSDGGGSLAGGRIWLGCHLW